MTVLVKICGLDSPAAAEAAIKAKADFAGLVFFPKSPRHVGLDQARSLAAQLRDKLRIVTLLVDPTDDAVDEAVAGVNPDFIQLHGNEAPQRVAEIAARAQRPIIKAIAIAETADVARAHFYSEVAQYYLFDAKADITATRPGGLGAAFDWKLISGASFARPWGLAGGLTPENVARAIAIAKPAFVDASSGVEDEVGKKSAEKIAAFVSAARNAPYTDTTSGA